MLIWKRILKGLAWLVGGTLALAAIAYLTLVLINWRDRPPSESAQRLAALYRNRPAVSDADNGYVYVMGFTVAPNADPQEAGARRLAWVRTLTPRSPFSVKDDPVAGSGYAVNRAPLAKQLSEACAAGTSQCARAFERSESALPEWINSEKWLLDRYMTLLHRPAWVETVPADFRAPLPAYGTVLDGQRLLFAQAYLLAEQKDADGVRSLLGEDVRFWRHVLASSDILLTKMIAVASLHRHFDLGNLVLRRLPAEMELQGMPQEWSTPMTDEERSLLRTYTGEWIFGDSVLKYALDSAWWRKSRELDEEVSFIDRLTARLSIPFYQPQDTSNRRAEMFIRASDAISVPLADLPKGLERASALFEHPDGAKSSFMGIYNLMGVRLIELDSGGYGGYGARVADVEGSRRAALLATTLRSRKADVQNISAELTASDIRAPYDNKPFQWDAGAQAIVFVGLDRSERGRHAFKY